MRRLFAAVLLPLALLSACGNDSTDSSADSSATEPAADAAAADDVEAPRFCEALTADQVGAAIGATVTLEEGPIGCEFGQEDLRALSGTIGTTPAEDDSAGFFRTYRSGAGSALQDSAVNDVPGIGEAAFVATGLSPGGSNQQGAGAALVGDLLVTVNLSQGTGMTAAEVTEAGTALLQLAVDAL